LGDDSKSRLTYSSYLKVNELLALQKPLSEPVAHDELLFIVIHQVYELWFKQVLFELDTIALHLKQSDVIKCLRRLERVSEIFRVLISQVDILETMTPVEFNRFRSHLNPASGFQSLQFRELELLCGSDPEEYSKFLDLNPEWKNKLDSRLGKPTLRQAFFSYLRSEGVAQTDDLIRAAILEVYLDTAPDSTLRSLCEGLIKLDEQVALWRFRHVQMVERMIGMKPGTGGSLGVAYLKTTLKKRFFPELWEARTQMGGGAY
jgi:tryptophan 2,3-dioxygenase